jgi:predicted SAM-dependent methyltransferase
MDKIPFLNLGCGERFFDSWINMDFISSSPFVRQHDLNTGIPLDNNSVKVVYHSHILEHFTRERGKYLIDECFRVLEPGGVIRIAVPDLEQIARSYIKSLENVLAENSEMNAENYNWSLIELFDQMIRNHSGGEMGKYWTRDHLINEEHITNRVGHEFRNFREVYKNRLKEPVTPAQKSEVKPGVLTKIKTAIRNKILPPGMDESHFTRIGLFRSSGEIHQWMYDKYSLKVLLENSGFRQVEKKDAFSSSIVNWKDFIALDVEKGKVRKPDSLFIEAFK